MTLLWHVHLWFHTLNVKFTVAGLNVTRAVGGERCVTGAPREQSRRFGPVPSLRMPPRLPPPLVFTAALYSCGGVLRERCLIVVKQSAAVLLMTSDFNELNTWTYRSGGRAGLSQIAAERWGEWLRLPHGRRFTIMAVSESDPALEPVVVMLRRERPSLARSSNVD